MSKTLLYQQLCTDIREWIAKRDYQAGDKLPTEREFCDSYQVSRATVRRALVELEKQGLIVCRQGAGIFVSPALLQQSLQKFYSFSKEMRKLGKTPSNQILSFQKIAGSARVCKQLELGKGAALYRIVRLRLADSQPYLYETTFIPQVYMPGFTLQQFEAHDLYDLMGERYQIALQSAKESFRPILPSQLVASYLGIKNSIPCMFLLRLTRDVSQRVVEYTESVGRGDRFVFEVELRQ